MVKSILIGLVSAGLVGGLLYKNDITSTIILNKENIESPVVVNKTEDVHILPVLLKKTIKNLSLNNDQVVYIHDEIGENAANVATQIKRLYNSKKPIYVLINSPGGSVIDGALIVTAILSSPVPVYTICESLCASMAGIIHGVGTERYMVDRSILMHHPASGGVRGTMGQMLSRLTTIDKYVDKMTSIVAKRAGLTLDQFKNMTVNEMWLDAEDALDKKFADAIVTVDVPDSKLIRILIPSTTENQEKPYEFSWK